MSFIIVDRPALVTKLQAGVVTIRFQKANGTERRMSATLNPAVIPLQAAEPEESATTLTVWDTEVQDWRAFRLDSILSVE